MELDPGKNRSVPSAEQGFALPLALGIGLIMLLMGITMIARSQTDQVTAVAQKQSAQGLAIAEAGIARTLSELQKPSHSRLLTLSQDPFNPGEQPYLGEERVDEWRNPATAVSCPVTLPESDTIGTEGSTGNGTYRIKAYRYYPDDERGTLLVEGESNLSRSLVQVDIPVTRKTVPNTFPGLYASNSIDLGNNDVLKVPGETGTAANVVCRDCITPPPPAECPESSLNLALLRSAVGAKNNSQIDGKIIIADPNLPPVPTPPAGAINLGTFSGPSLPRVGDRTSVGAPLHYQVTSLGYKGNERLSVDTSQGPIYLYVSGNITFSGRAAIVHAGNPADFRIYGGGTDQVFTLNGGASTTNLFIYAPNARMGINGGSSDPDIQGAVWVKVWNGSSSNQAEIRVPDSLPQALEPDFGRLGQPMNGSGSILSWQRRGTADAGAEF